MKITFRNTTMLLLILLTLLAMVVSYAYLKKGKKILLKEITNDMQSIVKMKAAQITEWYTNEFNDAGLIAGNYFLVEYLEKFITTDDAANKQKLRNFLESVLHEHDYAAISLFNIHQQPILSTKTTDPIQDSAVVAGMKQALSKKEVISTRLYTDSADSGVYLNFIAPVFNKESENILAALNLKVLASKRLYHMMDLFLLHWESFDLQLFMAYDKQITYLSDLLTPKNGNIQDNLELTDDFVAVKAVSGMEGALEGVDKRGHEVYAYVHSLQNTPWFLMAKIDRDVILKTLRGNVFIIILITLLSMLITLAGMAFLYNLRQKKLYRDMFLNRQEFRTTLYSIGDAVITTNSKGQINLLNPVAEQLTGWKESEAVGKPLEMIFRIINEDTRATVESPFKKVMETGNIVGLANHTLLISKDGTETPIADSGAPLKDEEDNITGVVLVFRDQTKQQKQQKLLEASETKYRQLVESTDSIAWEYDIEQDKWSYVSPTVTGKLGWLPEEWKDLEFWKENVHPDVREEATNYCLSCAARGESHVLEYPFMGKNGKYTWLRDVVMVETIDSKPVVLRGIMLDITERKLMEKELYASRSSLEALINNRNESIWSLDREYHLIVCNEFFRQSFFNAYGINLKPGINLVSILTTEHRNFWKPKYDAALHGEKQFFEFSETIQGKKHYFTINLNPIFVHGTVTGVSALSVEVTELIESQAKLKQSEEKFRRMFETHSAVHMLIDPDTGKIEHANQAAAKFYGWAIEELKKMKIHQINTMSDEQIAHAIEKARKQNNLHFEFKHLLANGKIRDVEVFSSKVEIYGKEFLHSIVHDVTEKNHLFKELLAAKEKAEESNRLKSAFLANMSHEIRTPLNGILGFANLITGDELPPKNKRREYSEIINRSAESLIQLINDILDISKLDSGQFVIESNEFNLNELLDSLYTIFRKKMVDTGKQSVKLNVEKKEDGLFLNGDEKRLIQIFTNLLDNAIKFTTTGEISFGIKEITPETIVFHVSDTGMGIEKSRQHIIFERFSQADESISRNFGGTGLGLSIVQKLLDLMDGQIHLKSEKGKGSSFFFHLPNTIKTDYNIPITHKDNNYKLNRKLKVLLVEDDPASQLYYQEILSKSKVDLMVAENGKMCLELAKTNNPDVILMDIRLPDISGLEIVKQIRNTGNMVKIIAQSAYAMNSDHRLALEAGCNDFISKPVKAELLFEKLKGMEKTQ